MAQMDDHPSQTRLIPFPSFDQRPSAMCTYVSVSYADGSTSTAFSDIRNSTSDNLFLQLTISICIHVSAMRPSELLSRLPSDTGKSTNFALLWMRGNKVRVRVFDLAWHPSRSSSHPSWRVLDSYPIAEPYFILFYPRTLIYVHLTASVHHTPCFISPRFISDTESEPCR
jgi:hypothetical protein